MLSHQGTTAYKLIQITEEEIETQGCVVEIFDNLHTTFSKLS